MPLERCHECGGDVPSDEIYWVDANGKKIEYGRCRECYEHLVRHESRDMCDKYNLDSKTGRWRIIHDVRRWRR